MKWTQGHHIHVTTACLLTETTKFVCKIFLFVQFSGFRKILDSFFLLVYALGSAIISTGEFGIRENTLVYVLPSNFLVGLIMNL